MIQFRNSMFETNSSSCHSLIIRKDDWCLNEVDNTPYIIKGGYYGRSPQLPLESTEEKLNYIWTMVNSLWGLIWDAYMDENGKWIPEEKRTVHYINEPRFHKWEKELHKMFPKATFIPIAAGDYNYGIDHIDELEQFANDVENNLDLLKYLLFAYSWISVSGDEYAHWEGILPYPWGELTEMNNNTYIYIKGN